MFTSTKMVDNLEVSSNLTKMVPFIITMQKTVHALKNTIVRTNTGAFKFDANGNGHLMGPGEETDTPVIPYNLPRQGTTSFWWSLL